MTFVAPRFASLCDKQFNGDFFHLFYFILFIFIARGMTGRKTL